MFTTWFEKAVRGHESFVIFGDRIFYLGDIAANAENYLAQRVGGSELRFKLSHGTPISDLEARDRLDNISEIESAKTLFISDALERDGSSFKQFADRYTLMRFIVDEIFPRMVAAPLEERIDAIVSGGRAVRTGKDILREALGDNVASKKVNLEVRTYTLERLERQVQGYDNYHFFNTVSDESAVPHTTQTLSTFSALSKNIPILVLGGKVFTAADNAEASDIILNIGSSQRGYSRKPLYFKPQIEQYEEAAALGVQREALAELKEQMKHMQSVMVQEVEYMPLMDLDEFRFQDIGFYRNGEVVYVTKRLPKFARQTTFDENLFITKEFDDQGFAGDFGIGLKVADGKVAYLGYKELEGGVVYRGPIKTDAPFSSQVQIIDPVMRAKYGTLRTICHVGGYPHFPMTPEGFIQFFNYATGNFLDSFRQKFVDQHFNLEDQARLLNDGRLLTKANAKEQGYMLTNIHPVEKDAAR